MLTLSRSKYTAGLYVAVATPRVARYPVDEKVLKNDKKNL
jgi:hypothetical protein